MQERICIGDTVIAVNGVVDKDKAGLHDVKKVPLLALLFRVPALLCSKIFCDAVAVHSFCDA